MAITTPQGEDLPARTADGGVSRRRPPLLAVRPEPLLTAATLISIFLAWYAVARFRVDMLAAWQRGDIDAGFVWEPTLIKMVEGGGEILVPSRVLADKGFITADVAVARKGFSEKYPHLVSTYLATLSKAVDYYRQNPAESAKLVAKEFNLTEAEALRQMKTLVMLNGKDQLAPKYLGTCQKRGVFAQALKDTADFLVAQKTIKSAPALAAFEKAMNPCYLEKAVK
jgi:taurine transport system substrate-binding protein